jgi:hypothetical protein
MRSYSHSTFKQAAAVAVVALSAWLPTAGFGQDVNCEPAKYIERLLKRYTDPVCRKADANLSARIEQVTDAFYGPSSESKSWIQVAREQLNLQLTQLPGPSAPESDKHIDKIKSNLMQALRDAERLKTLEEVSSVKSLAIDAWDHIDSSDSPGPLYLEDSECEGEAASARRGCAAVYAQAVQMTDAVYVTRLTVDMLHRQDREKFRMQVKLRGARWHAYLYDTQFQYWWELAANRYLEEKCPDGLNGYVTPLIRKKCSPVSRDEVGNPIGWREPPEYRAVVLHPEVGVQYNNEEAKGDRLKPSLVFQWIGYQWWDWKGDKVADLKGVSLVTTVSDNAKSRLVGHGIQIQLGRYALAVTSHGGKPALTFSMELLGRLTQVDKELADKLKAF